MNTKVLVRLVFIAAIVVLGYSLELLWQSHRREVAGTANLGHEKYVVIGGSIAVNLAAAIQKNLRDIQGRSDIDVIDMSDAMMSSDEAVARANQAIELHRPRGIVLMIGMNENAVLSEWEKRAKAILRSGDGAEFAKNVFEAIDEGKMVPVLSFFSLNREAIRDCTCFPDLVGGLLERVDAIATEGKREQSSDLRLFHLFLLVNFTRTTGTNGGVYPASRIEELRRIFSRLPRWERESLSMDYRAFVTAGGDVERTERSLFWYSWRRIDHNGVIDALGHFVNHAHHLNLIAPLPGGLDSTIDIAKVFPDPRQQNVLRAMRSIPRPWQVGVNAPKLAKPPTFGDFDLQKLFDFASKSGSDVRIFLLHYPGIRLPMIDELAMKAGVPALGKDTRLPALVGTSEEYLYFRDRLGGSGHLTELGLDLFGRVVATELTEVFR